MNLPVNKKAEKILVTVILTLCILLSSCSNRSKPLILWTNSTEFASYAELFNSVQNEVKVLTVYKENPSEALPPAKDEARPDIIIGPWLNSDQMKNYYLPLNYLFSEKQLKRTGFYDSLLKPGISGDKQYLLPVSFNLPVIIFAAKNSEFLQDNYTITLNEIRDTGAAFNTQNKSGIYTQMGYAPSWNTDFLYTAAKLQGASFEEKEGTFNWNQDALTSTVEYLRNWTTSSNGSTTAEKDYSFKYLYTPEVKWITEGKSFFAYTTSNALFATPDEKLQDIDFRWLETDGITPIEDSVVFMGLYRNSHRKTDAERFLLWFFDETNQKAMMNWMNHQNLVSSSFGIANGFSSLKSVNEHVFLAFYPKLIGNFPVETKLSVPAFLPSRWESLKEQVVIPYLRDATDTTEGIQPQTMQELLDTWNKQFY